VVPSILRQRRVRRVPLLLGLLLFGNETTQHAKAHSQIERIIEAAQCVQLKFHWVCRQPCRTRRVGHLVT
jgi:hypothetical protein